MTRKKTLLVGIDAACWAYVNPLLEAGKLPTLKKLMHDGSFGTLRSTMPALTPAAWSSIITGKIPGKHGIFDMTSHMPKSYNFSPVNAIFRQGAPFWEYLNAAGVRVGLVNAPFTYPTQHIDGFWVAGFGTPNSVMNIAYPERLRPQILAEYPTFSPTVDASVLSDGTPDEIFAAELYHQRMQTKMACHLAAQEKVDVLVINLMLLDHSNHRMPDMERVEQAIIESDANVAQLLAAFKPDNTLLISDHGSRRVQGDFLLHVWLRDKGYVHQLSRTPDEQRAVRNFVLYKWLTEKFNLSGAREKFARKALHRILPLLGEKRRAKFWHAVEEVIPFAQNHIEFADEIDFSRSKVFMGGSYSGILYLNVAGREPDGVIPPDEYEQTRREIMDALAEITDPETGKKVFTAVYSPQELYGAHIPENAPDIILDGYDSDWNILGTYRRGAIAGQVKNRYFAENWSDFGFHSRDGICVFAGKDLQPNRNNLSGNMMDVPATLLHLYGVPIPEDFDGKVMTEAFPPEALAVTPVQYQTPLAESNVISADEVFSEAEADELVAHLRALGYME